MLAIFKKEFRSFFGNLLGYIYLAANLFFSAWYFKLYQLESGYPYISYVINGMLAIFLFSLPLLTMRSFSEEMRHKTDQLLFTSPVPVWKIILGKYLAVLSVFAIPIFVISLYPLVLSIFGAVPFGENYLAVFGFFLFGAACLAIGFLISACTDNQLIAAVLTFFVILLGLMMNSLTSLMDSSGAVIKVLLSVFDMAGPFDYFQYGIFNISSLIYYLTVIFLSLFLTEFIIKSRRISFSAKGVIRSILSSIRLIAVVAVSIAINIFVKTLPDTAVLHDITYNRIYSISNETKNFIDNLQTNVTLYYLADEGNYDDTLEHTLINMSEYSDKIELLYVSPTENPYFYTEYCEEAPAQNSVIVSVGDSYSVIDYISFYEITYDYEYDFATESYKATNYSVLGYDGEGRLISAISSLTDDYSPKIYTIAGHDELEIEDALMSRLEKANIVVESINLLNYESIPDDAQAVFILGPMKDYSDSDVSKIQRYLAGGGNAIIVAAYSDSDEPTNYYKILQPYNISVHPGLVVEQGTSFYNSSPVYLLPDIVDCEFTEGVYTYLHNKYIYMPYCKGFEITEDNNDVSTLIFLKTTENAYCYESGEDETDATKETSMYALGVYAVKSYPDCTSQIVAFSSDYMLYQDIDSAVNGDNYDVFMNCVNKLVGKEENVSPVAVKYYSYSTIMINETFTNIFSLLLIVVLPAGIFIAGLFVWASRRRY